eukprot:m51a1_g9643 hypothetical protein (528) ;mRNA; r:1165695-1167720
MEPENPFAGQPPDVLESTPPGASPLVPAVHCKQRLAEMREGEYRAVAERAEVAWAMSGVQCYGCCTAQEFCATHSLPLLVCLSYQQQQGTHDVIVYRGAWERSKKRLAPAQLASEFDVTDDVSAPHHPHPSCGGEVCARRLDLLLKSDWVRRDGTATAAVERLLAGARGGACQGFCATSYCCKLHYCPATIRTLAPLLGGGSPQQASRKATKYVCPVAHDRVAKGRHHELFAFYCEDECCPGGKWFAREETHRKSRRRKESEGVVAPQVIVFEDHESASRPSGPSSDSASASDSDSLSPSANNNEVPLTPQGPQSPEAPRRPQQGPACCRAARRRQGLLARALAPTPGRHAALAALAAVQALLLCGAVAAVAVLASRAPQPSPSPAVRVPPGALDSSSSSASASWLLAESSEAAQPAGCPDATKPRVLCCSDAQASENWCVYCVPDRRVAETWRCSGRGQHFSISMSIWPDGTFNSTVTEVQKHPSLGPPWTESFGGQASPPSQGTTTPVYVANLTRQLSGWTFMVV